MSSDIVYGFEAIKFTAEEVGSYEDKFILVWQIGSSNCFETKTGRASRDWSIAAVGSKYQVMETMVKASAYCEGGMMKISGKSGGAYGGCTPETFIKQCRKALDNAVRGFDGAAERGLSFNLRIRLYDLDEHTAKYTTPSDIQHANWVAAELVKQRPMMQDQEYGSKYREFRFELAEVGEWFKHANNSKSCRNNAEVRGPRDPRPVQRDLAFA